MSHPYEPAQTPSRPSIASQPLLLTVVDMGLLTTLVLAPFLMGGRQALGQLSLCVLATLTLLAWSLHQCRNGDGRWRFTGIEPIMLLGLGLVLLQCWELTPELVRALSPRMQQLLPEWNESSPLFPGHWNRISFTPVDTWSDFVVLVACLQLFFVMVQRLRTVDDILRFIRVIALGGGVMATFGIVQLTWGNGKFFWFYDHPMTNTFGVAKGAFANPNHFANYLALTLPAQLLMLINRVTTRPNVRPTRSNSRFRRFLQRIDPVVCLWSSCLAVTALGIILSHSRIGLLSAALGTLITLVILWQKSMLKLRQAGVGIGLLCLTLAAVPIINREACPLNTDGVQACLPTQLTTISQNRHQLWRANMEGIQEFPLAGTGLGSHQEVYWLWFRSPQTQREYSHAENGYLQIAMETGLTGFGLVALLWLTSLLWCAQGLWNSVSLRSGGLMAVVAAGLVMSLVQAITDFVWYVPACVNIVLLYGVCAWRISLMRFFEPVSAPRLAISPTVSNLRFSWAAAVPAILLLGHWMANEKVPDVIAEPLWQEYLRLTMTQQHFDDSDHEATQEIIHRRISLALAAAEANPRSHRLQLHAGLACLKQFTLNQAAMHRQMPLSQIRDAARTLFESPEDMNRWLDRPGVLGSERQLLEEAVHHFQASLAACPLQPRPYLELAELVWLEGGNEYDERNLVQQAVTVRPTDARAHFALGRLLWLEGAQKEAAIHWQEAFRFDPEYRNHLIGVLADYVPARFFLDHFEPDHSALKQLRLAYRTSEDSAGYQLVLESLARSSAKEAIVRRGQEASSEWLLAHECFAELGDRKNAYQAAKEAVVAAPDSFTAHQQFGLWLYRNGMFSESLRELVWCSERQPEETWLQTITADARERIQNPDRETRFAEEPGKTLQR
ncbi:O-antigen ligase family protein [Planctomicrobium piriforme]|uniref:O-Antigen ligase n=1 Tax=Planctomicrobium piriforme TaxID=1576369 RepID=A0A1I3BC23_9PLAN|nr:O-antigen ligase family protein [Planctomicrobium piriforme]SFH59834.1 O-Antigen ligase [Planctomicrobium piriforme]